MSNKEPSRDRVEPRSVEEQFDEIAPYYRAAIAEGAVSPEEIRRRIRALAAKLGLTGDPHEL
jgi:hypothetical protein